MTIEELHELVDIVMDAMERGIYISLINYNTDVNIYVNNFDEWSSDYLTFYDFTQAVKDYIKSLG